MTRLTALLLAVVTLSACAAQRPPSREEILELRRAADTARVQVYAAPPERTLAAAARVLEESDSDYTPMAQTDNSTSYRRVWVLYMVLAGAIGQDNWKITATTVAEGTRVEAVHWPGPQGGGIIPVMTGGGSETDYTTQPTLYTLFHERLAYMLGERDDWVSCKTALARLKDNPDLKRQAPLHALCSFTTDKESVLR